MSKRNLFTAVAVAAFLLVLIPAPSQASSRNWTLFSEHPVAGIFAKIERWWNSILQGPDRQEPSPVREKNGCGIDPSGEMVCDPDPTARRTTQPGG